MAADDRAVDDANDGAAKNGNDAVQADNGGDWDDNDLADVNQAQDDAAQYYQDNYDGNRRSVAGRNAPNTASTES